MDSEPMISAKSVGVAMTAGQPANQRPARNQIPVNEYYKAIFVDYKPQQYPPSYVIVFLLASAFPKRTAANPVRSPRR